MVLYVAETTLQYWCCVLACRIYAVRAERTPGALYDLFVEDTQAQPVNMDSSKLIMLGEDDHITPYAAFPSLPLEYEAVRRHESAEQV